ncbi:hypothetical protein [Xenorhabdus eapokensis]|nr:hypothetical protein [Xenorhabdus eapokensis]
MPFTKPALGHGAHQKLPGILSSNRRYKGELNRGVRPPLSLLSGLSVTQ